MATNIHDHCRWALPAALAVLLVGCPSRLAQAQGVSTTIASAGADQSVRLWTPGSTIAKVLSGHRGAVMAIAFSADGRRLFSGGDDQAIRIWSVDLGVVERSIDVHASPVTGIAPAPDGRLVASAGADGAVKLWNAATGTSVATLAAQGKPVRSLAWSRDSALLASGGDDRLVQVWRSDGKAAGTIVGHDDSVTCLVWTRDGRMLLSAARDGYLKLWRVADFSLVAQQRSHDRAITAMAMSPSGERIVTAGADGRLRSWSLTLAGFAAGVTAPVDVPTTALAWDRGGEVILCGQGDGAICFRRAQDLSPLQRFPAHTGVITAISVPAPSR